MSNLLSNTVEGGGSDIVDRPRPAVLALDGELDIATAPAVRHRFQRLSGDVVVDCSGLTFIDVAGVKLLLEMSHTCARRGGKLTIVNRPPCAARLMTLVDFDALLDATSPTSST
jgi:anti-anti-sigma factor